MNNCDERIEKLLNRAGQTISDLPKRYRQEHRNTAFDAADKFGGSLSMTQNFEDYILHLTDIIDHFEWALENVCNERDYLAYRLNWLSMYRHRDCQSCERVNECERTPDHCLGWVFGGVPEDWSANDE